MSPPVSRPALPWLKITLLFLALRLFWSLWLWGVAHFLPPLDSVHPYFGLPPETHPWLAPWQRWDTPQYQLIAEYGYHAFESALFTPPLYPWLMRLLTPLCGGNSLLAGIVISSLCAWGSFLLFYRLAWGERKDEAFAWWSVLWLALFPTAFFLFAAYTEALYLLLVLGAFLALRGKHWLTAGLLSGLAALTRIPGWVFVGVFWMLIFYQK